MPYVQAQRFKEAKEVAGPWDEDQVRRVCLALLENEEAAEMQVGEFQLAQMDNQPSREIQ